MSVEANTLRARVANLERELAASEDTRLMLVRVLHAKNHAIQTVEAERDAAIKELATERERTNYNSAMKWSDKAREAMKERDAAIKERDEARKNLAQLHASAKKFAEFFEK